MFRAIFSKYFEQLSKHWVVIAALITFLASIVGIVSAKEFYSFFHVNYLELAEFNDFIKHLISRPYLGFVSLTVMIAIPAQIYITYLIDKKETNLKKFYESQKFNNIKVKFKLKFKVRQFFLLAGSQTIICVIAYFILVAITNNELERLKSTEYTLFNVVTDTKPLTCASYIGRVNINHIFWDRTNRVLIIPSSSIKSMTFVASLAKRPQEFVADNQVRTNEYLTWEKHINETCGKEFKIPALRK